MDSDLPPSDQTTKDMFSLDISMNDFADGAATWILRRMHSLTIETNPEERMAKMMSIYQRSRHQSPHRKVQELPKDTCPQASH